MNQKERVLRHLADFGSITPKEAVAEYGIYRLADVIFRLKKDGAHIVTHDESGKNRYGEPTHYARYTLGG